MLDAFVRPYIAAPFAQAAAAITGAGFATAHMRLLAFLLGFAAMLCAGMMAYIPALILVVLAYGLHALADAMAGPGGLTARGHYLKNAALIITLSGFIFFFALGHGHAAGAAAALFTLVMLGALRTPAGDALPRAFYHPASFIGTAETILFLILICLYPAAFPAITSLFALFCFLCALGHAWQSLRALK